jgi:hypothetical protein
MRGAGVEEGNIMSGLPTARLDVQSDTLIRIYLGGVVQASNDGAYPSPVAVDHRGKQQAEQNWCPNTRLRRP